MRLCSLPELINCCAMASQSSLQMAGSSSQKALTYSSCLLESVFYKTAFPGASYQAAKIQLRESSVYRQLSIRLTWLTIEPVEYGRHVCSARPSTLRSTGKGLVHMRHANASRLAIAQLTPTVHVVARYLGNHPRRKCTKPYLFSHDTCYTELYLVCTVYMKLGTPPLT